MDTDSEQLMREGIATGVETFAQFLDEGDWTTADIERTFCHQVGETHRRMMLDSLGLPLAGDFSTLNWLGNTGSVALPMTMALGLQRGFAGAGHRLGLLGIGSGINCVMMSVEWQKTLAETHQAIPSPHAKGIVEVAKP